MQFTKQWVIITTPKHGNYALRVITGFTTGIAAAGLVLCCATLFGIVATFKTASYMTPWDWENCKTKKQDPQKISMI